MKLVPPKKVRIFNYNSFTSSLVLEPKSLEINFKIDHFTDEVIDEIEQVLDWCSSHTEVKSIIFNSKGDQFIKGFNYDELKNYESETIINLFKKLHKINSALTCLPQTIIVDLKNGTSNEALVFAMSADIRVANENASFLFDQLNHGLIDASGLFSVLKNRVNSNFLRALILSANTFSVAELNTLGAHTFINKTSDEIINQIAKQSNIARLQTKCALLGLEDQTTQDQVFVSKLLNATLSTNDFKKEKEFLNLREIQSDNSSRKEFSPAEQIQ